MSPRSTGTDPLGRTAPLFAALGDETRLALVDRLCIQGPLSIIQLAADSAVTRQAITKHLETLAAAGLVHDTRRGRERIWTLDTARFDEVRGYLDQIARQWDDALGRLKMFVED